MNNCENARDPKFRLMEVTKRGTENTSYVQAPCSRLGFQWAGKEAGFAAGSWRGPWEISPIVFPQSPLSKFDKS